MNVNYLSVRAEGTITNGLLGYWKLDEANGDAVDSKNGNNFTNTGAEYSTVGKVGSAFTFVAASGDFLSSAANVDLLEVQVFTISAWINLVDNNASRTIWGNNANGAHFRINNDETLCLNKLGVVNISNSTGKITHEEWTYVAVTYDVSGNVAFYINGVDAGGGTLNLQTFNYAIGTCYEYIGISEGGGEAFNGSIDDVKLWNRALTPQEINEDYNNGTAGLPLYSTLLTSLGAYWKMEETSGTVYDSTVNNYDGTPTNSPTQNATGIISKGISFDRSDGEWIDFGTSHWNPGTGDFSFSAWFKTSDNGLDNQSIMGSWGDSPYCYMRIPSTGSIYGIINFGAGSVYGDSNLGVAFPWTPDTNWHHLVFTVDRNLEMTLYLDSIRSFPALADAISGASAIDITNSNNFAIGRPGNDPGGSAYNFEGTLDEIGIWTKALNQEEVNLLYLNGVGNTYPFSDVSSQNLVTYSEQLDNAVWAGINASVTATNAENDIEGNTTLDTITTTDGSHNFEYYNGGVGGRFQCSPNTKYKFSFDVKRGTMSELCWSVYDRTNSADIIPSTSYYTRTASTVKRVTLDFTTPAGCTTASVFFVRDSGVTGTVHIGRAQIIDEDHFGSAYIETTSAIVP